MKCFECTKEIDSYPCACGYQPKTLAVVAKPLNWIVRHCSKPGCNVSVREHIGQQDITPVCKWHKQNRAYASTNIPYLPSTGDPISKEEFGLDLFNAIKTQAALRQAERSAEVYERKGLNRQAQICRDNVKTLARELTAIIESNTLAPHDLKRVLEIT